MWEITRQKIEKKRIANGYSYSAVASHIGYSDTTVQRWLQDPKKDADSKHPAPKSAPPFNVVVDMATFVGCDIREITSAVGAQELQIGQAVGYKGTAALLEDFERWKNEHSRHCQTVIDHHMELRRLDADHHAQITGRLSAEVSYLKQQVARFRVTAIVLLTLFVLALLFAVYLVAADVPELGAGGTIASAGATPLGFLRLVTIPLLVLLLAAVAVLLVTTRNRSPRPPQDSKPQ